MPNNFIYRGGGQEVVPADATHVRIHESISEIPALLFWEHENIVELICHDGVTTIQRCAFGRCPRLKRLIIKGVETLGDQAFQACPLVEHVECEKLKTIGLCALHGLESLENINLSSVRLFDNSSVYLCSSLTSMTFGADVRSVDQMALGNCPSLERITIPLRNDYFHYNNIFQGCEHLRRVDLLEREELHETIAALLLDEWRNDMIEEVDSINQILPKSDAGYYNQDGNVQGEKTRVIREWISRVLRKINRYTRQHRQLLSQAIPVLQSAFPNEVVFEYVLPFLELPSHTFGEGEEESDGDDDGSMNIHNDSSVQSFNLYESSDDDDDEDDDESIISIYNESSVQSFYLSESDDEESSSSSESDDEEEYDDSDGEEEDDNDNDEPLNNGEGTKRRRIGNEK